MYAAGLQAERRRGRPIAPDEDAGAVSDTEQNTTREHEPAGPRHIAPRRSDRRAGFRGRAVDGPSRTALIIGCVGALLVFATLANVVVSWGRIQPGVWVGTIDVGTLTPQAARAALDASFAKGASAPVTLTWGGRGFPVRASAIGARLDTTRSVDAAMAVGRDGGVLRAIGDRLVATFAGVTITPRVTVDATAAASALDSVASAIADPARDATVTVNGTTVTWSAGRAGTALDRPATLAALLGGFAGNVRSVPAVIVKVRPSITDEQARLAAAQGTALIAGPVRVSFGSRSVEVPRATVARWVRFTTSSVGAPASGVASGTLTASFDATSVGPAVSSLTVGMTRAAKDASFVAAGGSVRLVPSQVGRGPDLAGLAGGLTRACQPGGTRSAALRLVDLEPALTTAAAGRMGIVQRISTFTTSYSTANPARVNNVHLLAAALNGKLVAPGAVFSFNQAAGQRTAAKGYQEAPAIVDGKLVPQLGGGVCQVGTTFFNAVFFSGLPVVERQNHSFYISHYPTGRDATVSWGGPDLRFRNDTPNWILVRTAFTATSVTIALYGTSPGYHVSYTTSPFADVVPFGVTEVKDPTLVTGTRVVVDPGVNGCTVTVARTVSLNGAVVRTDTFVSHYSPKQETVRVGTKGASTTPTGTL
jgi:vancomycin resistance protein YoaR